MKNESGRVYIKWSSLFGSLMSVLAIIGGVIVTTNPNVKQLVKSFAYVPDTYNNTPTAQPPIAPSAPPPVAPSAPPPPAPSAAPAPSTGYSDSGYLGNTAINPLETVPGKPGYDCTKGGCAPGVKIAGFYESNGKFYPISPSAGGPSASDLGYVVNNVASGIFNPNTTADERLQLLSNLENYAYQGLITLDSYYDISKYYQANGEPLPLIASESRSTVRVGEDQYATAITITYTDEDGTPLPDLTKHIIATVETKSQVEKTDEGFIVSTTTFTRDLDGNIVPEFTYTTSILTNPEVNVVYEKTDEGFIVHTTTIFRDGQGNVIPGLVSSSSYLAGSEQDPLVGFNGMPPDIDFSLKPNNSACAGDGECQSGHCSGYGGAARSICKPNPGLASLATNNDIPNYGSCQKESVAETWSCNYKTYITQSGLNAITFGAFNPYVNAYHPDNVTFGWEAMGFESLADCVENASGNRKRGCGTYNVTTEQAVASIKLGSTITSELAVIMAAPGIIGAGSVGGVLGGAFATLGAVTTMQQTLAAAVAHIEDPGSAYAWQQTVWAVLSWANIGTADYLVTSIKSGIPEAVKLAKAINTGVSTINVFFDVPTAISTCQQDQSLLGCGGAWAAVVADVGFGFMDYKQGQLSWGPDPLAKQPLTVKTAMDPKLNPTNPNGIKIPNKQELNLMNMVQGKLLHPTNPSDLLTRVAAGQLSIINFNGHPSTLDNILAQLRYQFDSNLGNLRFGEPVVRPDAPLIEGRAPSVTETLSNSLSTNNVNAGSLANNPSQQLVNNALAPAQTTANDIATILTPTQPAAVTNALAADLNSLTSNQAHSALVSTGDAPIHQTMSEPNNMAQNQALTDLSAPKPPAEVPVVAPKQAGNVVMAAGFTSTALPKKLLGIFPLNISTAITSIGRIPIEGRVNIDILHPNSDGYRPATVDELKKILSQGVELDPIKITEFEGKIYTYDGDNRAVAYMQSGKTDVPYIFTPFNKLDNINQAVVKGSAAGGFGAFKVPSSYAPDQFGISQFKSDLSNIRPVEIAATKTNPIAAWLDKNITQPIGDLLFGKVVLEDLDAPRAEVPLDTPIINKTQTASQPKIPYSSELDGLARVREGYNKYGERIATALKNRDTNDLLAIAREHGYTIEYVRIDTSKTISGKDVLVVERVNGILTQKVMPLRYDNPVRISADGTTLYVAITSRGNDLYGSAADLAHDIGAIVMGGKLQKKSVRVDVDPEALATYLSNVSGNNVTLKEIRDLIGIADVRGKSVVPTTWIFDSLVNGSISPSVLDSLQPKPNALQTTFGGFAQSFLSPQLGIISPEVRILNELFDIEWRGLRNVETGKFQFPIGKLQTPAGGPIKPTNVPLSEQSQVAKLVTGFSLEEGGPLLKKIQADQVAVLNEFGLPSPQLRRDAPNAFLQQVLSVAERNNIPIRSFDEIPPEFASKAPNVSAFYDDAWGTNAVYVKDPTSTDTASLQKIVHEVVHGLDYRYHSDLPIAVKEYRAYISEYNLSNLVDQNGIVDTKTIAYIFGDQGVAGSTRAHLIENGIDTLPWNTQTTQTQPKQSFIETLGSWINNNVLKPRLGIVSPEVRIANELGLGFEWRGLRNTETGKLQLPFGKLDTQISAPTKPLTIDKTKGSTELLAQARSEATQRLGEKGAQDLENLAEKVLLEFRTGDLSKRSLTQSISDEDRAIVALQEIIIYLSKSDPSNPERALIKLFKNNDAQQLARVMRVLEQHDYDIERFLKPYIEQGLLGTDALYNQFGGGIISDPTDFDPKSVKILFVSEAEMKKLYSGQEFVPGGVYYKEFDLIVINRDSPSGPLGEHLRLQKTMDHEMNHQQNNRQQDQLKTAARNWFKNDTVASGWNRMIMEAHNELLTYFTEVARANQLGRLPEFTAGQFRDFAVHPYLSESFDVFRLDIHQALVAKGLSDQRATELILALGPQGYVPLIDELGGWNKFFGFFEARNLGDEASALRFVRKEPTITTNLPTTQQNKSGLIGSGPAQFFENLANATIYKWLPGSAERGTLPVLLDMLSGAWRGFRNSETGKFQFPIGPALKLIGKLPDDGPLLYQGREIGHGAQSIVYEGVIKEPGTAKETKVAIKELKTPSGEEADLIAQLNASEIGILTSTQSSVKPWYYGMMDQNKIVIEYVEGTPINQVLKNAELDQRLAILTEMKEALQKLHQETGLPHGDLNTVGMFQDPYVNARLTPDGRIIFID